MKRRAMVWQVVTCCGVLAMAMPGPPPALGAGKVPVGETVTERPRPKLDPLGVRAGAFTIYPMIEIRESYDSNVFATETGTSDDLITVVHPSIRVKSETTRHRLDFQANARVGKFADNTNENYEDMLFSAQGRLDILRRTRLFAALRYQRLHQDRSSPDDPATNAEPVEYGNLGGLFAGEHVINRLGFRLEGNFKTLDYDDASTAAGAVIDQDDRDRSEYEFSLRTGYELALEYEAFVRLSYNLKDYDDALDSSGLNRDSSGYEVRLGATADFSGVTFGEIFAGFLSQSFDDSQLDTVSGPGFGAALSWNPSGLTTVKANARRVVKETTLVGVSGILSSTYSARIDHALLRELMLNARIAFTSAEYEGDTREDDTFVIGFGAQYMMTRHYYLGVKYSYLSRDSTEADQDYDQNLFTVRLGVQY